jgi:hypothetical protein
MLHMGLGLQIYTTLPYSYAETLNNQERGKCRVMASFYSMGIL